MWVITKTFDFEAAHALPYLPEGHKCRNLHGHSYELTVEIAGQLDERGFVMDYAEITQAVKPIISRLDHQNLNDLFDFRTSCENIARWIFDEIQKEIPLISTVILKETAGTSVRYSSCDRSKRCG